MSLSDVACRNAKPEEKPYKMGDSGGLYLSVQPNGSKLWRMKYRFMGKEKTLSIGPYPEVSLSEAREARDKARKLLKTHQDPSIAKQEEKRLAAISASNTFQGVALAWHEKNKKAKWSANHAATVLRRLEVDVFPFLGSLPIKDITTPRLARAIEEIEKRGAHDMARRALQYCRAIFAYATVIGLIDNNPANFKASDILSPQRGGHFAAMEAKDLPEFLKKLYSNDARLFRPTQLAMELMMLTFVRTDELIKAQWNEFDLKKAQWLIPAARMKMKRDHIVPLSNQAVAIIEELHKMNGHRPYVFPGQRDPKGHMSDGAILMALQRMGYRGIHTGHGFRALAMSTLMEELEYPYAVIDLQLAHVKKSDVEAAYNRAKFIKERTRMMQDWADYIEKLYKERIGQEWV